MIGGENIVIILCRITINNSCRYCTLKEVKHNSPLLGGVGGSAQQLPSIRAQYRRQVGEKNNFKIEKSGKSYLSQANKENINSHVALIECDENGTLLLGSSTKDPITQV